MNDIIQTLLEDESKQEADASNSNANPTNTVDEDNKTEGNDSEVNANKQDDKTDEGNEVDYQTKYKESSKEAIRLYKENKAKEDELKYLKAVNKVRANPDLLKEIYEENQELANKLSQEIHGKSFNEFTLTKQPAGRTVAGTQPDIKSVVEEVLSLKEKKIEKERIENVEAEFIVTNNLVPGGKLFKDIMTTYNTYKPQNSQQAQDLLGMAYLKHTQNKAKVSDISNAPMSTSSSITAPEATSTSEFAEYNKELTGNGMKPIAWADYKRYKKAGVL